jgi:hypothetical protein
MARWRKTNHPGKSKVYNQITRSGFFVKTPGAEVRWYAGKQPYSMEVN